MARKNHFEILAWQQNAALFAVAGIVLFLPIIVRFYWPAGNMLDVTGHPIGRDFINVWVGPQVVQKEGVYALFDHRGYAKGLATYFGTMLPFHNWGYPIFVLPFYWIFAQLPYALALALWTALFGAAYIWVATFSVDREKVVLTGLLIAFSPAAIINTVGGQNGFITAALLLGGMLLLDRRPIMAGVLIGLLIFKPHLGVCLPFVLIALRAWRTLIAAALVASVLLVYTIPIFGLGPWIEYFAKVGPYQAMLLEKFQGFYPNMMVSITAGLRSMGVAFTPAMVMQACVSVGVLVTTAFAVQSARTATTRAFVVAAAAPLITPYAFNYDLTALGAAVAWCIVSQAAMPKRTRLLLLLIWLTPAIVMLPAFRLVGMPQILMLAAFIFAVNKACSEATTIRPIRATG